MAAEINILNGRLYLDVQTFILSKYLGGLRTDRILQRFSRNEFKREAVIY